MNKIEIDEQYINECFKLLDIMCKKSELRNKKQFECNHSNIHKWQEGLLILYECKECNIFLGSVTLKGKNVSLQIEIYNRIYANKEITENKEE